MGNATVPLSVTKEINIMWRKVSVTINHADAVERKDLWIIAHQRVYIELWKRAGRGKNISNNHIGNKGDIILNGENGAKIPINWTILDVAKENNITIF